MKIEEYIKKEKKNTVGYSDDGIGSEMSNYQYIRSFPKK